MNNNNFQNSSNNDYSGMKELWDQEQYMPKYNKDLVFQFHKAIKRISPDLKGDVLDFGAGIGVLASIWRNHFGVSPPVLRLMTFFVMS